MSHLRHIALVLVAGAGGAGLAVGAAAAPASDASAAAPRDGAARSAPPPFRAIVRVLSPRERRAMIPSTWRPGCPVHLAALRRITAPHHDFRGRVRYGTVVVHNDVAGDVIAVLRRMYATRFPLRRMVPVERYGGDDMRSVRADNTSAFNCRTVAATSRWSHHAFGRAIDINPLENPYVRPGGRVSDPRARRYVRRAPARRGMLVEGGPVVRAFDALGWDWGGRWSGGLDHQHFSRDGG